MADVTSCVAGGPSHPVEPAGAAKGPTPSVARSARRHRAAGPHGPLARRSAPGSGDIYAADPGGLLLNGDRLGSAVPTYAGGLGVQAGDMLRAAADLAVPVAGVTLLHRQGYFRQRLDPEGNQTELPATWRPEDRLEPLEPRPAVMIEGRPVLIRAWRHLGNVKRLSRALPRRFAPKHIKWSDSSRPSAPAAFGAARRGGRREATMAREARLKKRYAAKYHCVRPGVWQPAVGMADQLLACLLEHPGPARPVRSSRLLWISTSSFGVTRRVRSLAARAPENGEPWTTANHGVLGAGRALTGSPSTPCASAPWRARLRGSSPRPRLRYHPGEPGRHTSPRGGGCARGRSP